MRTGLSGSIWPGRSPPESHPGERLTQPNVPSQLRFFASRWRTREQWPRSCGPHCRLAWTEGEQPPVIASDSWTPDGDDRHQQTLLARATPSVVQYTRSQWYTTQLLTKNQTPRKESFGGFACFSPPILSPSAKRTPRCPLRLYAAALSLHRYSSMLFLSSSPSSRHP